MQNNQFWFNNNNKYPTVGTVAANNFNSSDWTQEGPSTTWTFNPNNISVVGTAGLFTPLIRYNKWFSQCENFTFKATYSIDLDNTVFLGVGIKAKHAFSSSDNWYAYMSTATGPTRGAIYIYRNSTVIASDLVNVISYNVDDIIEVSFMNNIGTFTATFRNITQDGPLRTISVDYSNPFIYPYPGYFQSPVIFQPAFQCSRGEYTITSWSFTLNVSKKIDLLIIGDSKSEGYYAPITERISGLWKSNNPSKVVQLNAGSGNVTQDILNNMPEILIQEPKNVILFIGRNDISNGVLTATWQANYASIVSQLEAIGCVVWHQLPTPDSLSQVALTNYINATYTNLIASPPTFVLATDTVDNIHPNVSGSLKIYNQQAATVYI